MERHGIPFLILWLAVCISVGYARAPKKIIAGMNALDGEFPYQVSIHQFNQHWCGGSILDATHILTAAHCLISKEQGPSRAEALQVITGTIWNNKLRNNNVFAVSKVIRHNDYTPEGLLHASTGAAHYADIAVLKLARRIPFNTLQKSIGLPNSNTPPGALVVTTGWGISHYDRNGGSQSVPWLKKLQMKTISLAQCQVGHPQQVNVGQICATSAHGSGTCFGDSGGPLAYKNKVVGIVSWSGKCCADGSPGVFTNVYDYLDWINSAMKS